MGSHKARVDHAFPIERNLRTTVVAKTLWPGMNGSQALTQAHGDKLVCVRYRHDESRTVRFTTIEILVDEQRIRVRPKPKHIYGVWIDWQEQALTRRAKNSGGLWDEAQKLWRLTGKTVIQLGIAHRIRQR